MRTLRGLEKLCKLYGRFTCDGVIWAWDYARNVAVLEKDLKADKKRWAASEKARWTEPLPEE